MKNNIYRLTLLAAGKMYLAAEMVIKPNALSLSGNIYELKIAMEIYNNEIMKFQDDTIKDS